jgi:hypothetical protein
MNITPWPMKHSSSIVTPSQMKGVALDLAPLADVGALLDLDKRPDARAVIDATAVEIDEREDLDVLAEHDIGAMRANSGPAGLSLTTRSSRLGL